MSTLANPIPYLSPRHFTDVVYLIINFQSCIFADVDLPSYTEIHQWKQIIVHLARFLRLVDCLLLNLLRRLTTRGIELLCAHVVSYSKE